MARFEVIRSAAIPIAVDNIDTDQVFPARFSSKDRRDGKFRDYFMHDRRFDEQGNPVTDFIMNDPRLSGAQIVVAAANYGAGSGRPGAIFSHVDYGIRVVVAESFGPVFAAAAYKAGLLTIELRHDDLASLRQLVQTELGAETIVDLERQVIAAPDGTTFAFDVDPFVRKILMSGTGELDLTLSYKDRIEAFEGRQRSDLPWLFNRSV